MRQHATCLLLVLLLSPLSALAQSGAPKCPNILIVFDVSGSMSSSGGTNSMGQPDTRLNIARSAVKQLVTVGGADKFRYGLELFGLSTNGNCGISSATCSYPTPNTCQSVACDFNTASNIAAVLNPLNPQGSTPTSPAIETARMRPDMNDVSRPRYVLLATDGEPSGCDNGTGTAFTDAVTSISNFRTDAGVKTFVLGLVGGDPNKLGSLAIAGGAPRPGCDAGSPTSCYYLANNAAELQAALDSIVAVVSGELGTAGGCDETCYGQGCPAGQICKASACVVDPCASVTCGANEACVDGTCKKFCSTPCGLGQYCNNGQCVAEQPCMGGCSGRNQICVNGMCVEDYCSGETYDLAAKCGANQVCYYNGCSPAGTVLPDGGVRLPDGGTGGPSTATGCCTGAPEAFSALALALGLSALAARRRRVRP